MKTNVWLILGAPLAMSALAQPLTNPPQAATAPAPPPPAAVASKTTAPAAVPAKAERKMAVKTAKNPAPAVAQAKLAKEPVFLSPGPATITGDNVNVRGQATIHSEVITQLDSGDRVTVIEQVIRDNPKAGDPTQWAKIGIPSNVNVWVHASYVDAASKAVFPRRLNVRTGPGENYSIVGLLEQGAPVREISRKGDWMEIEAPADTYAFVAAMYVKQEGPPAKVPTVVSIAPPLSEPAPTPAVVPEPTPVAATTTEAPTPAPVPTPAPAPTPAPEPSETPTTTATAPEPAPEPTPAPPPFEEPPPERIVQHEGVVKGTWSIQAPTRYALVDPDSGRTVNYLYTSSTNLDLSRYKGLRIIVTGEEGLDERWKNTPVITIRRIQVVPQE